jgi:hypothetical protein
MVFEALPGLILEYFFSIWVCKRELYHRPLWLSTGWHTIIHKMKFSKKIKAKQPHSGSLGHKELMVEAALDDARICEGPHSWSPLEYKHWQCQHSPLIYKQRIVNCLIENQETGQRTSDTHAIKPQTHNPILEEEEEPGPCSRGLNEVPFCARPDRSVHNTLGVDI